ncbi:MAG: sigma-70 family RNA polymerase sigma factor [Candidatus Omnitrophota bacterium]
MAANREDFAAELAERHGRMVYTAAYRILGDADDAEDVLQDVFLKLLRTDGSLLRSDAVREWGAYLRVMAVRCAVDFLRRDRLHRSENTESFEQLAAPAEYNPHRLAEQKQMAALLRQALQSLSEREAQIFALRYFEELSYEEIAAQLDLNTTLVGVVLHRARQRLREILQPSLLPQEYGSKSENSIHPGKECDPCPIRP